jgi:hypothetical protein
MSTAVVFLNNEKAFNIAWQHGLPYKFSVLEFSIIIIMLISSFISQRKFRISVEGEMSTQRYMQAGVLQCSSFPYYTTNQVCAAERYSRSHQLYSHLIVPISLWNPKFHYRVHMNYISQTFCVHLALFADDTYPHAIGRNYDYVL